MDVVPDCEADPSCGVWPERIGRGAGRQAPNVRKAASMHTETAFRNFAESGARNPREIKPAIAQETDAQVGVQRFTIATPQAESAFDEADCA